MLICRNAYDRSGCGALNPDGAVACNHCHRSLQNALTAHNPGTIIRDYQIETVIGSGGFGVVYKSRSLKNPNQYVALKQTFSPDTIRNFQHEFSVLSQIQHPNLPRYYEMFVDNSNGYLVMEFIQGNNLAALLEQNHHQPFDETLALSHMFQICTVLEHLHRQQPPIIHRDIKPQNILITPAGQIKLVDFGLVKQVNDMSTQSWQRAFSPLYSPPEQLPDGTEGTDQRSDIYSLGATLYFLLTGEQPTSSAQRLFETTSSPPLSGATPTPISPYDEATDALTLPTQYNPTISPHVNRAIVKAMRLKKEDRFPDIGSFHKRLLGNVVGSATIALPTSADYYTQPTESSSQPSSQLSLKLLPVLVAVVVVVILSITILAYVVAHSRQSASIPRYQTAKQLDGELVFRDTFKHDEHWETGEYANEKDTVTIRKHIEDGSLVITTNSPATIMEPHDSEAQDDLYAEVDVQFHAGDEAFGGIVFGQQADGDYCLGYVATTADDPIGVLAHCTAKRCETRYAQTCPALKLDEQNHLALIRQGDTVRMYINEQPFFEDTDTVCSDGTVGLVVGAMNSDNQDDPVTIHFDEFKVWSLPDD